MADDGSMTRTVDVAEARARWDQILEDVFQRRARVVVEKDGVPIAAVISAKDHERMQRWEAERARRFAILDEIGAAFADVPAEDLEREVAKAVAEARAELRAEREQATRRG